VAPQVAALPVESGCKASSLGGSKRTTDWSPRSLEAPGLSRSLCKKCTVPVASPQPEQWQFGTDRRGPSTSNATSHMSSSREMLPFSSPRLEATGRLTSNANWWLPNHSLTAAPAMWDRRASCGGIGPASGGALSARLPVPQLGYAGAGQGKPPVAARLRQSQPPGSRGHHGAGPCSDGGQIGGVSIKTPAPVGARRSATAAARGNPAASGAKAVARRRCLPTI
jgi:hypothetical protein